MNVAIYLGRVAYESRVLVGGVDLSSICTGVEVTALVGEPTRITLHLIARCEIVGEIDRVEFQKPKSDAT